MMALDDKFFHTMTITMRGKIQLDIYITIVIYRANYILYE